MTFSLWTKEDERKGRDGYLETERLMEEKEGTRGAAEEGEDMERRVKRRWRMREKKAGRVRRREKARERKEKREEISDIWGRKEREVKEGRGRGTQEGRKWREENAAQCDGCWLSQKLYSFSLLSKLGVSFGKKSLHFPAHISGAGNVEDESFVQMIRILLHNFVFSTPLILFSNYYLEQDRFIDILYSMF